MTLRFLSGILGSIVFHVIFVLFAPDVVLPKMSIPEYKKHEVSFVNRHLQLPEALIHKPIPKVPRPRFIPLVEKPRKLLKPIFVDPNSIPKIRPPKLPLRPSLIDPNSILKIKSLKLPLMPVLHKEKGIPSVKRPVMPVKPWSPKSVPNVIVPKYPVKILPSKKIPKVSLPKKISLTKKLSKKKRKKIINLVNKPKIFSSTKVKFSDLSITKKAKLILVGEKQNSLVKRRFLGINKFPPKNKELFKKDLKSTVKVIDIDKYLKQSPKNISRRSVIIVDSPLRKEIEKRNRRLLFSPPPPKIKSLQTPATVVLKFWVLSDGSVGRVLVERKANVVLEVSAINHLKRWKFSNLNIKDKSNEQWGIVVYRFFID